MQSHYITHNNSTIHYLQFGNGPKLLFCFHGYGRESDTFYILERRLGKEYTIIGIDIPYHGRTQWNEEMIFNPEYLVQFMVDIQKKIGYIQDRFSILGFSMGGRIALYLTQLMPQKVEKLILLAPDGLTFNFWRWLGTHTMLGNKIIGHTIRKPGWALSLIKTAENLKVIPGSVANFVRYYIEDEDHRVILYRRYFSTRKFDPSLKKLKSLIKEHSIKVRMMFGLFDRVIPIEGGKKFKEGIEQHVTMHTIEAGHNILSESQASRIVQLIIE